MSIAIGAAVIAAMVATSRAWTRIFGWPAFSRGSAGLADYLCCLVLAAEGLGGLYLSLLLRRS